jgi:cation diffusion facilitator CzcD-associated flavoprotein CzcO
MASRREEETGRSARTRFETAVIGAGPYGLSIAAHLRAAGQPTAIFGRPLEFWRSLPQTMLLKSPWSASSLSDPSREFDLGAFLQAEHRERVEPVPLPMFLSYCRWFTSQAVGEIDQRMVRRLSRDGDVFRLELADGQAVQARRVVVAAGIAAFAHLPEFACGLPPALVSHTQDHADLEVFSGRHVIVVGAGQSGLETATMLAEAGASVELVSRGPVLWADRRLYEKTGVLRHVFYPPADVGPVGLNWLVAFPSVFRRIPDQPRLALSVRAIRPSGAKWLRGRFTGRVRTTESRQVAAVRESGDGVRVELSDGTSRVADHLFCGTGYRPDLERLAFLDPQLVAGIQQSDRQPLLNRDFESSVPRLHFVGAIAGHTFGPLCRFVAGARPAARRITAAALSGS